jgi:YHS domain-containing protein
MKLLLLLAVTLMSASLHAADEPTNKAVYPLAACVVSGDKLGGMGGPVIIHYHGTEVRFCCHECVASFNENPAKYLAKLKAASANH